MANSSIVSISDGPAFTVRDLVGSPMMIPTKLAQMMTNVFISESLFRNAGPNPSGIVGFEEGMPMFLTGDVEEVAEFGEIPLAAGARGLPRFAVATKRGLGVRVSKEMIDENRVGAVQDQMTQLRNTFTRADDAVSKGLLSSNVVPTMPVDVPWDNSSANIRRNVLDAKAEIMSAAPAPGGVASSIEWYGFMADTLVINPLLTPAILDNEKFVEVYKDSLAAQNPAYLGTLPQRVFGLTIIESMAWPTDRALMLQRGVAGFYSDTRALQFTGLYPEGNGPNGGPRETWRSDATRKRAIGIDQPKAALWLTGLVTP